MKVCSRGRRLQQLLARVTLLSKPGDHCAKANAVGADVSDVILSAEEVIAAEAGHEDDNAVLVDGEVYQAEDVVRVLAPDTVAQFLLTWEIRKTIQACLANQHRILLAILIASRITGLVQFRRRKFLQISSP
jgi:hypothetical protein